MAALIASHDWAASPLGAAESWTPNLRMLVDLVLDHGFASVLLWTKDLIQIYNDDYRTIMGNKHPSGLGQRTRDCWPEVWSINAPIYEQVWAGETLTFADKLFPITRSGRLEDAWFTLTYCPVRENGTVQGILVTVVETTQGHLAAQERERSRELLRQFGEAASDVLWIRDAETLRWQYLTPAFEAIYGIGREEALQGDNFQNWLDMVVLEDRADAERHVRQVGQGDSLSFEYRIRRPRDGAIRWLRDTDFPMRDADGAVTLIGGVGHDITLLKQAEEQQRFLVAELQHRVRNTLAVIRSIVRRTAQRSETLEENVAHLEGRINAFARVQAAVTRSPGRGVDLYSIVADELGATGAQEADNLFMRGDTVELNAKAAESIALAVHELATNAIKYGALTTRKGRIAVDWRVEGETLHFSWAETGLEGLPPVFRRGFGTEVLEQTLSYQLNARTEFALRPEGVRFQAWFPLAIVGAEAR